MRINYDYVLTSIISMNKTTQNLSDNAAGKSSFSSVICAAVLVLALGNLVGCSIKEKAFDENESKNIGAEYSVGIVNTATLRVRDEPDGDAQVFMLLPNGAEVSVLAEENGFYKVSWQEEDDTAEGYVRKEYVDVDAIYSMYEETHDYIILPSSDKITAVSLEHDGTVTNYDGKEWMGEFISILIDMESTNELSVQDMPNVDDYTKIDLVCSDDTICTLFYYEKDETAYIEQPYQGIYSPAPALGYYIDVLLGGTVDYPVMLMVDGQLYRDFGTVLTASLPLEPDGQIISTCDGVPIQDNQSNFGIGYSYKYGADNTIDVLLDDNEWHVFVPNNTEDIIDFDNLSEKEKMELDPTYIPNDK